MNKETIQNVSDTALWVAVFRAQESERKDAVFKDTLARKLAGERGAKIVASTPDTYRKILAYVMTVRTYSIDRLIERAIARNIDTVINLGAGLDTRPYRMQLPATLKWIEVDLPGIIEYKTTQLANEKAVCQLQRIAADLSDDSQRTEVFSRLGAQTKKALVITEGLIPYLSNKQAAALSASLYKIPSFYYWIQDYSQGENRNRGRAKMSKKMLANAPFRFDESDPIGFFGRDGWKLSDNTYMLDAAKSIKRSFPLKFPWNILMKLFPKKMYGATRTTYGYAMFSRE